jgi:hypothetical protein
MISEETPLVSSPTKHEEVYKRFKPAKKRAIVALVSVTGLLARTSFCPSCISSEFCGFTQTIFIQSSYLELSCRRYPK